jgi:hypothetical protein
MTEDFEILQSEFIKKIMYRVMKNATQVVQGFIFFRNRIVSKVYYDEKACDDLLVTMVINKDNVIKYLERKYIPTFVEKGALFKDQKCIQSAMVDEDGTMVVHIAKSEPHKIITDTIHVRRLLIAHGFKLTNNIIFKIDQIQIAYQDTLLYNILLTEFGLPIPAASRMYAKQLLQKYGRLEEVAKIKKRSVKRKFCRYYAKQGKITWKNLRTLINIVDFSPVNIKKVCNDIRDESRARGVVVDF